MQHEPRTTTPRHRTILAVAAGLLGGLTAVVALAAGGPSATPVQLAGANEDISGPCDEAEHANDPRCTGAAGPRWEDDRGTTTTSAPGATSVTSAGTRIVSAGDAGVVIVAVEAGRLRLVDTVPNEGWAVEVEQATGREVEVKLTSGARRVDVNVEIEDGRVRERVRTRDDATRAEIRTEDGVVVRVEGPRIDDDSSGPGSGDDDRSGRRSGDDDDHDDDRSGRRGGDDDHDDDSSGPGSDD